MASRIASFAPVLVLLAFSGACDRQSAAPPAEGEPGSRVIHLTDANFDEQVLRSKLPVLVDFWAVWCGPCRQVSPVMDELAQDYEGRVKVGKLDVDRSARTARRYEIRSIPAVFLFKDGKVAGRLLGAQPKAAYQQLLAPHVRPRAQGE